MAGPSRAPMLALLVVGLAMAAGAANVFVTTPSHVTHKCNGNILGGTLPHYWYRVQPEASSSPTSSYSGVIPELNEATFSTTQITMYYCTMELPQVPTGSYCFLQNRQNSLSDWCPPGFTTGSRRHMTEDDLSVITTGPQCTTDECRSGLPRYGEGRYTLGNDVAYVTWYFCCRDNATERATQLNFDGVRKHMPKGFVLYRKGGSCQGISGRAVSVGSIYYDDEDGSRSGYLNENAGMIPDGTYSNSGHGYTEYQFCSYSATTVPYEPATITVTDRSATSVTVQWTGPNIGDVSASYYNIRVKTLSGTVYAPTGGTDRTTTNLAISSLTASTSYEITVYSGNDAKLYESIGKTISVATCATGWSGTSCSVPICSPSCGSHGSCTAPNTCTCQTGWAGATCTSCASGYFSQSGQCVQCPACVNGYCSSSGTCVCTTGWTGPLCSTCANGYYSSSGNCLQCHSSCANCSGGLATQCSSCSEGRVLTANNECSSSCPSGQFLGTGGKCLMCQSPCATCTSLTACESCVLSTNVLQGTSCVPSCNEAHYVDSNRVCRACDSRCTVCADASVSNCTACASGYVLRGTTCITPTQCTSGNGYVSGSQCLSCHASCSGCTGGAATQCIGCAVPSHVKQGGACLASCNAGYAPIGIECTQCPSPCATCASVSASACTSCLNGLALFGSTCVESCPTNMYRSTANVCMACHTSCATCSGAGASACLSCANATNVVNDGACVSACPAGRYADSSKTCRACNQACATCAGSADYCLTCASQSMVAHEGACLPECPAKFYAVDGVCVACDSSCERCSGPGGDECTACAAPAALVNGTCVAESACLALPGYVDEARVCHACSSNCVTCAGSPTTCTSCLSYQFLSEGTCVDECGAGTYLHEATSTCRPCVSPCATCVHGPNQCTSCEAGLVLEGTVCRDECYMGEFASEAAQPVCGACNAACAACEGPSSSDCTLCAEGGCTSPSCTVADCAFCGANDYCLRCNGDKLAHEGVCVDECPDGTVSDGELCRACDETCASCVLSGSAAYASCASCQEGLLLTSDGRCLTTAQCEAENAVGHEGACVACDVSCDGCVSSAGGATSCTACANSTFVILDGVCEASCRASMFVDADGVCQACSERCAVCSSSTECTVCDAGYYLFNGGCVLSCGAGTITNDVTRRCDACFDSGCRICASTLIGDCLQCESGLSRHNGRCVNQCTGSTFNTSINGEYVCTECAPNCAECTGYLSCSRCTSDALSVQPTGVCAPGCPYGMYSDNGVCKPCHSECKTCFGGTEVDCHSCPYPNVLHEVYGCLEREDCVRLGGHYVNEFGAMDTCEQCDPACEECEVTATQCTKCRNGDYVNGTLCVSTCPPGTVLNEETGACSECYLDCATCTSRTAEGCTSCRGSLLLRPDNRCASSCPAGSFDNGQQVCELCHESCSTCQGAGISDCLTCANSSLVLNGGRCMERCPTGSVRQGALCVPCQSPCLSCERTPTYCTLCDSRTLAASGSGQCLSKCPDGQYVEGGVCTPCARTCRTCDGGSELNCTSCFEDVRILADGERCACLPGTGEYSNGTEGYIAGRCLVCQDGWTFDLKLGTCVLGNAGGAVDGNKTAVIVGAVVGAIVLLLLVLLVILLVLRRRTIRKNKEMQELMGARGELYMVSGTETGRQLTMRSRSIMESSEVEATLLNTQLELALPGFLKLDFDTDLRLGDEMSVGGTAVLYKADLVSPALQREHGTERVAVKHLTPGKDTDMMSHLMRFRQEVAIMWTLGFHPNIVKLIGYTEDPTCLVMHLYDTDLGRYLYNLDNTFTPQMAFSVACKIASALAAIHKHNCIHRDIKSANVLVNVYENNNLDVFICDFGIARNLSAVSVVSTFVVNGLSARYAAPQVFDAMASGRTLDPDTDRACDIYAFGIILWELVARHTPWEGLQLAEIQQAVSEGHRPSFDVIVDPKETLHVLIRDIAIACWRQDAAERPTMEAVVKRLTVDV